MGDAEEAPSEIHNENVEVPALAKEDDGKDWDGNDEGQMGPKGGGPSWDAISGEELPRRENEAARKEELACMEDRVWKTVPISQCVAQAGHQPISAKMVDRDKGDLEKPDIKSRSVALEIA